MSSTNNKPKRSTVDKTEVFYDQDKRDVAFLYQNETDQKTHRTTVRKIAKSETKIYLEDKLDEAIVHQMTNSKSVKDTIVKLVKSEHPIETLIEDYLKSERGIKALGEAIPQTVGGLHTQLRHAGFQVLNATERSGTDTPSDITLKKGLSDDDAVEIQEDDESTVASQTSPKKRKVGPTRAAKRTVFDKILTLPDVATLGWSDEIVALKRALVNYGLRDEQLAHELANHGFNSKESHANEIMFFQNCLDWHGARVRGQSATQHELTMKYYVKAWILSHPDIINNDPDIKNLINNHDFSTRSSANSTRFRNQYKVAFDAVNKAHSDRPGTTPRK